MFPRAARFSQRKLSDTPGPNAYDPTEMMAHYQKGLLNQTDARFKSNSNLNDEPSTSAAGLASNLTPQNRSNGASAIMDTIGAKEKTKLLARLAKAEEKAAELEKQTHCLSNERSQAMADLRRSQQLVDKLQSQANKTKGQSTKAESSQAKYNELQRTHEQASVRWKSDLERWEAKCSALQSEKEEAEARLQEARAVVSSTEKYVQTLRSSESNLRQQLEGEKDRRKQTEDELSDALQGCEAQESAVEKLLSEKWHQLDRIEELQGDKEDIEEALDEQCQQRDVIQRIAISALQQNRRLEEELVNAKGDAAISQLIIGRLKTELQSRKETEEHLLDTLATVEQSLLFEQAETLRAEALAEEACKRHVCVAHAESENDGISIGSNTSSDNLQIALVIADTLAMIASADLREQREVSTRLTEDIDEMHERYLHLLRKNATMNTSQQAMDKLRQELESVEESYDKTLLELMRAHRSEEAARGEISQLKSENQGLVSKVKHFEQLSKKVFHAKVKEEAYLQEREELLQELGRLSRYEGDYQSLRTQAQMLLSKSTSYESQMEEMSTLNIMLASHTNPSQKVVYLERVRRELDDKKVECQLLHTQKEELQMRCKSLQEKVDLFCKIDNKIDDKPRTGYRRVTRQASTGVLRERSPNLGVAAPPLPRPITPNAIKLEVVKTPITPRPRTPLNIFKWSLGGDTTSDTTIDDDAEMTLDEIMVSV